MSAILAPKRAAITTVYAALVTEKLVNMDPVSAIDKCTASPTVAEGFTHISRKRRRLGNNRVPTIIVEDMLRVIIKDNGRKNT